MNKKIAYVANIRFPSERAHSAQIAHMCQAFVENGATVDLIVNTREIQDKDAVDRLFKIDSQFRIIRLPYGIFSSTYKIIFFMSELWFTFAFIIAAGVKKYEFILSRSQIILWTLSFFVPPQKLIWESHDGQVNFFVRRILKKAITVIVTSRAQVELFSNYNKHILLAPNAVDQSFFEPVLSQSRARERLTLPLDKKLVLYIGGFDAWKGVHSLFEVSQANTDYQIVVIGGSSTEIEVLKNKYPKVLFLGSRPYSELKDNQQAADVLVVPNTAKNEISEKFTSPLKLFAHMTSGVPLVVSDIESIRNAVPQGLVSYVVPDDSAHLKIVLDTVFQEYEQKKKDAMRLQALVKEYTWTNRAKKILAFLHKRYEV